MRGCVRRHAPASSARGDGLMPKPVVGPVWYIAPDNTHAHTMDDTWEVIGHASFGFNLYHNDGDAGTESFWTEARSGFPTMETAIDYAEKHPRACTSKYRLNTSEREWVAGLLRLAPDPDSGGAGAPRGGGQP